MEMTINLLPPEKKKLLNRIYLVLHFRFIIELLLFYSLVVAVFLILVNYLLNISLQNIQEKTASLEKVYTKINQDIRRVNQDFRSADLALSSFRPLSPLLSEIFKNSPAAVSFSGLSVNQENKILTIQGRAKTREDILLLKENLEKLEWIKEAAVPVSALTVKEDVDFTVEAKFVFP